MKNKLTLTKGRVNQKIQTRSAILKAARLLMEKEKAITLEQVAKISNTSRATVYRYFPNVDILCAEAALDIQTKASTELVTEVEHMDIRDRIFYIQNYYNKLAEKNEQAFRRYLSVILQESTKNEQKVTRGARRVKTLKLALEPFKSSFNKKDYEYLVATATILMGIDAFVSCKDVCRLNNRKSHQTLKWSLEMVLNSIL